MLVSEHRFALLVGVLALGLGACGRRSARKEELDHIAKLAVIGSPTLTPSHLSAGYEHGRIRTLVWAPLDRPLDIQELKVAEDTPVTPIVSPDARFVMYRDGAAPKIAELVVDARTGKLAGKIKAPVGTRIETPRWSPDSQAIAYWLRRGDQSELRMYRLAEKTDQALVVPVRISSLDWSSDGKSVVYRTEENALYVVDVVGGAPRKIETTEKATGCVEWSPDGKSIAFCAERDQGCAALAIHDLAASRDERIDAAGCVSRVAWAPDGKRIATWAEGHPVSVTELASRKTEALSGADELLKSLTISTAGAVVWVSEGPSFPMTFWQVRPGAKRERVFPAYDLAERWIGPVERLPSPDATIYRRPRTCGDAARPGPVVLWLTCADQPQLPVWEQNAAYLAANGVTQYMIDLAGDRAAYDQTTRIAQATRIFDELQQRPDVDRSAMFMFFCCGESRLGYGLLGREAKRFKAAIDLHGAAQQGIEANVKAGLPIPLMFITFERDGFATTQRHELQKTLAKQKIDLVDRRYNTNHTYQDATARQAVLSDLTEFITQRSTSCGD